LNCGRNQLVVLAPHKLATALSFHSQYNGFVEAIRSLVVWEVKYNMALLQQLSATTTSVALISEQTFPNVTQRHFEISGGFADGMGGIMMTLSAPLIVASEREAWEKYSVAHQGWLDESVHLKSEYTKHRDPLHGTAQDHEHDRRRLADVSSGGSDSKIPAKIWKWDGEEKVVVNTTSDNQVLAPLWQSSPADAGTVNVDLFSDSHISQLYRAMIKTRQTVMSPGIEIGHLFDWMFDPEEKHKKVEPHAFIMEPILSNFTGSEEPVGFIMGLTSFKNFFTRLLPEGANGIYCVMNDTCGTSMTFLLNGPEVEFLGYADLHEGLDEYERVVHVELYQNSTEELCVHDLFIYPSQAYMQSYESNKPG
jgi:hypothetical protein